MPAVTVEFNGDARDLIADAKSVQKEMDILKYRLEKAGVSQAAYNQAATNANKVMGEQVKQTQKSSMSWTDFRSMYSTVVDVVRVGQQVFQATVGVTQEYDQKVYDLMLTTKGTADETSRLIQVLDDTGIQYDTLKIAMKELSKDGTQPNIAELARLSDEFLALNSGAERGKFLLDKFGKSGMDMSRAMEMGGDALRKMGDEMKGGLILTEANIKASEEYRKNVDELDDSWNGFVVTLGNDAIPVLNELYDVIGGTIEKNGIWETGIWDIGKALAEQDRWEVIVYNAVQATGTITDSATNSYIAMAQSLQDTTEEQSNLTDTLKETSDTNLGLISLTQTLQGELDTWKTKTRDVKNENVTLEEKLAALGERTVQNATEWDATTAALDANAAAATRLAADHDAAMKKIVADLYIAKLSVGGLEDAEYDLAIQALVTTGQIDVATAQMAEDFETKVAEAVRVAKDEVVVLGSRAEGLAKDYFMNFVANLTINSSGMSTGSGSGGSTGGGVPTQHPTITTDKGNNSGSGNADIIAAIYIAKDDLIRGLRDIMLQAAN